MKSHGMTRHGFKAASLLVTCLFAGAAMAADAPAIKGDAQAGSQKVSMCIGCHGIQEYKAAYPELYHVPMIAGQNAEYIVAALKEYASGARSFPTMDAIAKSLTEQDMADVAAYYHNLK
ncbi:c-type cytochrome [uncultured Castellaniella sp.]|uniref:c-type cytochrome n=1 Tax=uncultured Castellaniella sp. TaxID=647907 RepID=UPI002626919A|nr:c-type cytochrome [uncultured Castellaniella sp.]